MTSVVFVHGTGVRAKSYEKSFARVVNGLGRVRAEVRVVRCLWGEEHGASLGLDGASVPVRSKNRGVGGGELLDEDDPLAVWALLEVDPLAELREFAEAARARRGGGARAGFAPGRQDPWHTIADRVRGLSLAGASGGGESVAGASGGGESLAGVSGGGESVAGASGGGLSLAGVSGGGESLAGVSGGGESVAGVSGGGGSPAELVSDLAPHLGPAAGRVAHEISRTLGGTPPADGIEAIAARAVYALAVQRAEGPDGADEPLPVDGADRDAVVGALTDQLGGTDRGGFAARAAKGVAVRALNSYLSPLSSLAHSFRAGITRGSVPAGGDILRYQARGAGVRAAIRAAVREAVDSGHGPVALLAHSLGGIACVDLLAEPDPPAGVELLVTVGSQAPFLYELDALTALRRGEPLPAAFPRWINVYDEHDLLGFVGAKVFPGRVTDLRVDTRQPFPRAHTSYFAHHRLYELLAPELP
ncbi:hypothetical protein ACH4VS_10070 [Streptomyces hygroscopicus]|uniref:hypothetical protein n=1 Tax=Streptomyces hygroscopicus TaxID=1912 RepID=UPI00082F872E|nr:hypothetical protein [Streptomyces hygroscopicus]GLV75164.1 hypothetical protein Shyhy02_31640 [Streptomyces hygroscopicus subsp. hygroscopicus]